MTIVKPKTVGAPKVGKAKDNDPAKWKSVKWNKVSATVKRLKRRIAKAVKEGKKGKVKVLTRILTCSFSAKLLAVKRVTSNKGKRTPGIDKVVWKTPEEKWLAALSLRKRNYNPQPLRRKYIKKKNGKLRPLGIPTMKDRAMQALYATALEPIAEAYADQNSYGFRTNRSTHDAIGQLGICLSRKHSCCWILEGDIKACFDKIRHEWLLDNIPIDRVILKKWLKSGYIEGVQLFPTKAGTPQGGLCKALHNPPYAKLVIMQSSL